MDLVKILPLNICRCCLAEGCYKDISTEYFWSGRKEIYANMLLDTFNVIISHQEGGGPSSGSRLICEACIRMLRMATEFKQHVLMSEQNFSIHLKQMQLQSLSDVKPIELKPKETEEAESFDENNLFDDNNFPDSIPDSVSETKDFYGNDLDLKHDIDDDAIMDDNGEGQLFVLKLGSIKSEEEEMRPKQKRLKKSSKKKRLALSSKNTKSGTNKAKATSSAVAARKRDRTLKTPPQELRMRRNTVKLALNSNMCLFKSTRIKYQCFFCRDAFIQITDLKEHVRTHSDAEQNSTVIGRSSFFKNAEITNLTCKLCSASCDDINSLQEHLTDAHDIAFEQERHLLVPYRIESGLLCALCSQKFNTFVRLSSHMNTHYTNHVCENCGQSFINKLSLRVHVQSMHKEKKCTMCPAVFHSNNERMRHRIKVHNTARKFKRYCPLCSETFSYSYQLFEHKIAEHGAVRETARCGDCDKTFISPNNLKIHIRSVHLRERNHPCALCAMRFFTRTDRLRHERTHDAAAPPLFACTHCDTKLRSKDSWRRHVHKQHAAVLSSDGAI